MNEDAENDQDMDRADENLVNKTALFGLYPGDDIDEILALKKQWVILDSIFGKEFPS